MISVNWPASELSIGTKLINIFQVVKEKWPENHPQSRCARCHVWPAEAAAYCSWLLSCSAHVTSRAASFWIVFWPFLLNHLEYIDVFGTDRKLRSWPNHWVHIQLLLRSRYCINGPECWKLIKRTNKNEFCSTGKWPAVGFILMWWMGAYVAHILVKWEHLVLEYTVAR